MAGRTRTGSSDGVDAKRLRQSLRKQARAAETNSTVPDLMELGDRLHKAAGILDSLDASLRPPKKTGTAGGLLILSPDIPALVLPDLHARAGLLRRALEWTPPEEKKNLIELVADNRAVLLLLGDLFHSEGSDAPRRWREAYREYLGGFVLHEAMDQEMGRGFRALDVLAQAMILAPGGVLCLKGNHDNSRNREGCGDHGFYKFADEGSMCGAWLDIFADPGFRDALAAFEDALPLAAAGSGFVASHAEPAFSLTAEDVIEGSPETVEALTWTANDQALPFSVEDTLRALLGADAVESEARWIAGHRPVDGRYALRAEGLLVQIHDPFSCQGAWVRSDRPFDPETDVRLL